MPLLKVLITQLLVVLVISITAKDAIVILTIAIASIFVVALRNKISWKLFSMRFIIGVSLLDYDKYFVFYDVLRIWYLFVPFLIFILMGKKSISYNNFNWLLIWMYALVVAVFLGGILDFGKYTLYFLFILALQRSFKTGWYKLENILDILFIPIAFSLIQFVMYFTLGFDSYLWDTPRPSAYFSESTWLSAYCIMFFYFIILCYEQSQLTRSQLLLLAMSSIFVFLDARSINGFIGLFILILALYLHYKNMRLLIYLSIPIVFTMLSFTVMDRITNIAEDPSLSGRILGFQLLMANAADVGFWGTGFSFNYKTDVISSGAALGSKAFSLPFQIFSVGGFPLLILVSILILRIVVRDFHKERYIQSGILFSFLLMSCFAPLAQGIVGMMFVVLRLNSIDSEKIKKLT